MLSHADDYANDKSNAKGTFSHKVFLKYSTNTSFSINKKILNTLTVFGSNEYYGLKTEVFLKNAVFFAILKT